MAKIIGIDLGTSTSEAAVIENGQPVIIHNFDHEKITPSVVGLDKDGNIIAGKDAAEQYLLKPNETVIEVKRLMGSDETVRMGSNKYTPVQISSYLLKYIKDYAESYLNDTIDRAVITVPAYFNEQQRKATVEAGIMAGLKVERIINEPTAAALCYGLDNLENDCHVLVYDFGGGTFDVTLLEMFDGVIEVKASSGNNKLGGKDFDEKIIDYLVKKVEEKNNINLNKNIYAMVKLKEEAEKCKIALSNNNSYDVIIPLIAEKNGKPISVEETITREMFEELIIGLVEKTKEPIDVVLNDSKLKKNDIDIILLVGGSTRIPLIQRYVEELIGKKPEELVDPDLAVAMGACIQAGILNDEMEDDIFITDVNPYALGVRVADMFSNDNMSIVIPRNMTIPVTKSEKYCTNYDYQAEADIEVYQGDNERASRNNFLGKFRLSGIPSAKQGVEKILVEFSYDINGLLKVEGTVISNNQKAQISIDMTGVSGNGRIDVSKWADAKNAKRYRSVIRRAEKLVEKTIEDELEKEDIEELIYLLKKALITETDNEIIDRFESELIDSMEDYM